MTDNSKIWLSLAHMGGQEQRFVQEAFDTNWVVPLGPNVDGFERDLAGYLGVEPGTIVALSSGTAAIHLALLQLGVQAGAEVICQSFTFSASANPIKYLGANPVFIDSEADTWNMCPVALERAILDRVAVTGKKPLAIIPVHLYGMPANIDAILSVAERYGIPVLEDAAEALGSRYKGRLCGTFGQFACLSFNGNKMITTSGGGALVCSSAEVAGRVKFLATQARDAAAHYQHSQVGYNYRLSNICAGIGRGQMLVLNDHITHRRQINTTYRTLLANIPGITFLTNPKNSLKDASNSLANSDLAKKTYTSDSKNSLKDASNSLVHSDLTKRTYASNSKNSLKAISNSLVNNDLGKSNLRDDNLDNSDFDSNHWLTSILVDPAVAGFNREELRIAMEAANIETRPLWKPMHLQPIFADCPFYTSSDAPLVASYSNDVNSNLDSSISSVLFEHGLCLPSSPVLSQNDIERVVNVFLQLSQSF